ncbi:SufD family Fe-S cluster assembly protein [Candidatus Peregrinibacteria bacterium]|nr:SufD family Fe-S cluster assembly protein [Candidatus Peregrinibacteria bacterium]
MEFFEGASGNLAGSLIAVEPDAAVFSLAIPARTPSGTTVSYAVTDAHAHLCVIAGEDAVATVFLHCRGCRCAVEVFVGKGATLEIICLQSSGAGAVSITQRSSIAEGGTIHWRNVTLGTSVTQDLESRITEPNAVSDIDWVSFALGQERQTLTAHNVFNAARGGGEITMRGIAQDRAHAKCSGMIIIGEGGAGTDSYLTQDVLMLDPTAKVDAVPGLEIRTNDVKASHSATVARITQEDLFYFAARGIEDGEARGMLVEGFLGELLAKISDAEVRGVVEEAIHNKLGSQLLCS